MSSRFAPALLVAVALTGLAGPSVAQTYIGKVCLAATVTERQSGAVAEEPRTFAYDATALGGSHYAISGTLLGMAQPAVATGLGTLVNGVLVMNLLVTLPHVEGWRDTGINRTELDLSTMTGSFYEVGHDFDRMTKTFDRRFTAGTVAMVACP